MSGTADAWERLEARLDRLAAHRGEIRFWLRDDDAADVSPALERLLAVSRDAGVPLALAAIPARATPALAGRLERERQVFVLQHGWSHANHAPPGEKRAELGDHRPLPVVLAELAIGRERLAGLPRCAPILVPPWNRIGAGVAGGLAGLGFRGLSLFSGRKPNPVAPGVMALDTHLDPVDWRSRGFKGEGATLDLLGERLAALADGRAPDEPTGILTHHLVHDDATFTFLSRLLRYLANRKDCRFLSADDLLANA